MWLFDWQVVWHMAKESLCLSETAQDITLISEDKSKIKWERRLVTAQGVFFQQNSLLCTLDAEHSRPWRPCKHHIPCSKHCFESWQQDVLWREVWATDSGWNIPAKTNLPTHKWHTLERVKHIKRKWKKCPNQEWRDKETRDKSSLFNINLYFCPNHSNRTCWSNSWGLSQYPHLRS